MVAIGGLVFKKWFGRGLRQASANRWVSDLSLKEADSLTSIIKRLHAELLNATGSNKYLCIVASHN